LVGIFPGKTLKGNNSAISASNFPVETQGQRMKSA
jgi:hypothetical protein